MFIRLHGYMVQWYGVQRGFIKSRVINTDVKWNHETVWVGSIGCVKLRIEEHKV